MGEGIGAPEVWLAVVVFAATLLASFVVRRLAVRLLDRGDADRRVGRLTGRFLSIVVVVVGLVYALGILNIQIGPLLGALGVGGIALAFAAQDILQNFVAGVLLQIRRPFRVRDQISSGDFEGTVIDVNLRTVELITYDGLTVYLPNAEVLKTPIVNYTRTPLNRTSMAVGVAYDTDLEQVRTVLLAACQGAEGVESNPGVEVWIEDFGDSSINCAVRYWHASDIASRWRVRSAVACAVKQGLDEAGMAIPFPQRTVWFGPSAPLWPQMSHLHLRTPRRTPTDEPRALPSTQTIPRPHAFADGSRTFRGAPNTRQHGQPARVLGPAVRRIGSAVERGAQRRSGERRG